MSTISGSRRALIFEESIIDYILSSHILQYLWAACRYNILISVSELVSSTNPAISEGCFNRIITSEVSTLSLKKPISSIGNTHITRKMIRNRFKVIWNPDIRLRQFNQNLYQKLDVYGELLDNTTLVIPVESAYRLLQARLISQYQFSLSVSLAKEIEQARCMIASILNDDSTAYRSEVLTEISYFCSDIQAYLEDILGKNKEILSICAANIREILVSASSIPYLATIRFAMNVNVNTGLVMHCGNYVLDPILVLIWKMSGYKVCDYTHAYAGVGHIAYTQRHELISLPTYQMLMPDITVGGLHMWKPLVSGETVIDTDSVTEWIGERKRRISTAKKTRIRLLFVSTSQYSKEREKVDNFLSHTVRLVNLRHQQQDILLISDIRFHPKEMSRQELLCQKPIEDDLSEAEIVIGEFSTCLLQAEDLGKMTITVASDLHNGVYSSINTYLLSGYAKEDARKAADHIGLYIRGRYFG